MLNPLAPDKFHRLTVKSAAGRIVERCTRRPTYDYQLDAFQRAVERSEPVLTGPDDAIANMVVIDAVYGAAGLEPRRPTA